VLLGVPLVAVFSFVAEFYVESTSRLRLSSGVITKASLAAQLGVAVVIEWFYDMPTALDIPSVLAAAMVFVGSFVDFWDLTTCSC
jgi:hypothetical protein